MRTVMHRTQKKKKSLKNENIKKRDNIRRNSCQ